MRRSFTLFPLWICLVLSIPVSAQNTALELNDTNYVFYPGIDPINPNGDLTVEFWAYVPSLIQDGQMHQFISQGDYSGQDAFYMGYDASGNIVAGGIWQDINGNPVSTGVPMPVGRWTHLALSWSAESYVATLYVNGIQAATDSYTGYFTDGQTGLVGQFSFNDGNAGSDNAGMTNAFDGTANTNDGVLANIAMTGTTSNLVSHPLTGVPLPILLTGFTASRQGNSAILQWQTAQEENTRAFLVQRSSDGNNFSTIGTVEAAGNSSLPLNYSFVDGSPAPNDNYYRLAEVDLDGYTTYTPVRLLVFSGNSGQQLIWYPTGYRTAEVSLTTGSHEWYTLTDISGRTLRQGQLSGGKTDISRVPPGVYVVKVLTTTGQALTTKVLLP